MQLPPIFLVCAAGLATFGVGQVLAPTVRADTVAAAPALQVSVQRLHVTRTPGGIEITGQIKNTGRQPLCYTSVVCVFTDPAGREVGRGDGYLTAGPVAPGEAAGFRAMALSLPPFTQATLRLREAGQAVTVESPAFQRLAGRTLP